MVSFPAPIGGTVLPVDFAPSILFAILYGLLIPLMFYRMLQRRGRCLLLINTISFSVERVVVYSLRASQAYSPTRRMTNGLIIYMQVSLGLGYIGISNDLVNLLRCLLVNPTYGSELYEESPAAATKGGVMTPPPEGTPDLKKTRFWARRFTDVCNLSFIAATVTGAIASSKFDKAMENQVTANSVATLRIASGAVCLFLTLVLLCAVFMGKWKLQRMSERGARVLRLLACLVCIISFYRLAVMPMRVTSLTDPSSLNTSAGKAAFYILHVLPEWLASVTLFVENIRKTFGTGLGGDYRARDETPSEKEKRHAAYENRRNKKAAKEAAYEMDVKNQYLIT